MKRIILTAALLLSLLSQSASADIAGTRRMERDNRRCARYGQHYERDGTLTSRELRHLERINCKRSGDTWVSSLYYAAEEP